MSLFANAVDPVLEELGNKLQAIDPNALSPMQALLLIDEWKKLLDQLFLCTYKGNMLCLKKHEKFS